MSDFAFDYSVLSRAACEVRLNTSCILVLYVFLLFQLSRHFGTVPDQNTAFDFLGLCKLYEVYTYYTHGFTVLL